MERYQITAELRDGAGKGVARKLRAAGRVPAIAYGKHIEKPISLSVLSREMVTILRRPTGRYMPLDIVVGETTYAAVVRDFQVDALTRSLKHCDFLLLEESTPVKVKVPILKVGKSKGEAVGARLILARREVQIKALPADIPPEIGVDVSHLETGDVIYIDELNFPEGVTPSYRTRYPVIVLKTARISTDDDAVGEGEEGEEAEGEEEAVAEDSGS